MPSFFGYFYNIMKYHSIKCCIFVFLWIIVLTESKPYECNDILSCDCDSSKLETNLLFDNDETPKRCGWPMVVSLRYNILHFGVASMHTCAGTIVSNSYILTAASCLEGVIGDIRLANVTVIAGLHSGSESDQVIRKVDRIIVHENWIHSSNGYQNNIALVHLTTPLELKMDSCITRTCFPRKFNSIEESIHYPSVGTDLVVIGWDRKNLPGNNLGVLTQNVVSSIDYNDAKCISLVKDTKAQFCAGSSQGSNRGKPIFRFLVQIIVMLVFYVLYLIRWSLLW